MKEFEQPYKKLTGLRAEKETVRNEQGLVQCLNWISQNNGLMINPSMSLLSDDTVVWGGLGKLAKPSFTVSITIRVTDYVSTSEVSDVTVYLDGVSQGTTDASGELTIADVSVGGHTLKLTKTGYDDSDTDVLYNDYIVVTS